MIKPLSLHSLDYASAIGYIAYAITATVTPVCLLAMAGELNFQLTGGGGLEAVRTVSVVLVLLISGFIGARWGKSRVLGWSALMVGVGMLLYALAPSYGFVLLAMIFVGLGAGSLEGLINPLIHELHPQDSGRYLNTMNGFWCVGVIVAVLASGELLTRSISWRWIMAFSGLLCLVAGALYLLFQHRGPVLEYRSHTQSLEHMTALFRRQRFWVYAAMMLCAGGVEGGLTFWTATYIQLHFDALPRAGGIGTACFAGGMMAGRFLFGHLVHQDGLWRLMLWSAVGGTALALFLPLVNHSGVLFAVLFFAGWSVACLWPSIQSYACARMPASDATMLMILLSCAGIPGFGMVSWIMGWVGDQYDLNRAMLLLPAGFVVLGALLLAERARA